MAKWQGKTNASIWGIKFFVFVLNHLGLSPAYLVLRFVAFYYFLFARKSNRSQRYFLREILHLSPFKSLLLRYRNYYVFGQTILDKVALLSGVKTKFTITHEGGEFLETLAKGGKGGILISGHLGNWEIAGQLLNRLNTTFNILMYENEKENIKSYLSGVEKKKNVRIIAIKEGELGHIIELNNAFKNNELVVMHGDRFRDQSPTLDAEFLGKTAKFPAGPFILAAKFGVPVSVVFAVKETSTHYHFFATPPIEVTRTRNPEQTNNTVNLLLKKYIERLEFMARTYPEQWFNYYPFWNEQDR